LIKYPKTATERFDQADLHISYVLLFVKKFIKGKILEVGAGCGSFTKKYVKLIDNSLTLTDLDEYNFKNLKKIFLKKKVRVLKKKIFQINENFNTIMYFHVLEHIKNDMKEIKEISKKLTAGGFLIIVVPAHRKLFSNLDSVVGHCRRYNKDFFKKKFFKLERIDLKYLDITGYILYFLNKIFYKKETFPSKLKIFIWDKFFTPLSFILDFLTNYRFGKCIIAIYKKNI